MIDDWSFACMASISLQTDCLFDGTQITLHNLRSSDQSVIPKINEVIKEMTNIHKSIISISDLYGI